MSDAHAKALARLLAQVAELERDATPVPWWASDDEPGDVVIVAGPEGELVASLGARPCADPASEGRRSGANAALIVALVNGIPLLLEEHRRRSAK